MQFFHFDEEDLATNRSGKLSDQQKQRFMLSTRLAVITALVGGVLMSAVMLGTWDSSSGPVPWWAVAMPIVLFVLMALVLFLVGRKVYGQGIVQSVRGTVTFKGWGFSEQRRLEIDGLRLPFKRKYKKLFLPGIVYTIYYAPSDGTIVSTEIVEQ